MTDSPAEPVEPIATRADHHGTGVEHPTDDKRKKRSLVKTLMRIVIVLMLLSALLVALAPMLLSTGPGTRLLVNFVNSKLPGDLSVEDLSLSWFGGQRIEDIRYDDPAKGLQATVATLEASDIGLFDLLTGSRRLGQVTLSDGSLLVTQADTDRMSAEKPGVDPLADRQPLKLPPSLSFTLTISNVTAAYQPIESESIRLTLDQDEIKIADLRDITFEMDAVVQQGLKKGSLTLKGDVLNLFNPEGVEQAGQAAYDIALDVQDVPTRAIDQIVSGMSKGIKPGRVVGLLGEGELVSNATLKGTIESLTSKLTIQTPKLYVGLKQQAAGQKLIATPDSHAKLKLDQDAFKALFPDAGLTLAETTQIDLDTIEIALPIVDQAIDWDTATATLLVKAGDNLAVIDERGEKLWINDLKIAGDSKSIAEKLTFKLTTMLSTVTAQSDVTQEDVVVDLDIYEPLKPTRRFDLLSDALPIQLTDALMGQNGKLVMYLGKRLSLHAELQGKVVTDAQGKSIIEQHFSLRPDGRVNGTITGSFAKGRFTLATPADEPVQAVLVPEAFASLMEMLSGKPGQPALTIGKDMPVYLAIRDPKRGPVAIVTRGDKAGLEGFFPDPDRTYLGATIELSPARVFDPKLKKTYELRGGSLTFSAPDLRGKTQIRAELDLWVRPDAGQEGVASLLTWQTTITDLLDTEGSVPLDSKTLMQQLAAEGGLQSRNVPSGLLDSLLDKDGDLASILGPIVQQMDAGFTYKDGQATGATVHLNWDEKNNQPIAGSWASMKPAAFDIDDQQMMTVRGGEDLELQVRVSEDFGDRWMGKLHPVLFDAKSGDRPVKIKIDGKSFRFPLANAKSTRKSEFDGTPQDQPNPDYLKGSHVQARVDLGTIQFGDDALLGKIMQWTKRPGERAIFEPAAVNLIDGKISYDKLDLAVGNVKLRFDGDVDVVSGRIGEMFVRVPGTSLIRVFNELDGVIKPDDFLSIPMTGEIRKPEFDSNRIGREVARLVAAGLIDQQKDKLGDLIKKEIGGDEKPKPDGETEPKEQETAKDAADELLNRGLDLLFKRLGKDKNEPKKNE